MYPSGGVEGLVRNVTDKVLQHYKTICLISVKSFMFRIKLEKKVYKELIHEKKSNTQEKKFHHTMHTSKAIYKKSQQKYFHYLQN